MIHGKLMNVRRFSRSPTPWRLPFFSYVTAREAWQTAAWSKRPTFKRRRCICGEEVHARAFYTPYLTSSIYHIATCRLLFDPIEVPYKMAVPAFHHHVSLWISLLGGSFPYVHQCLTRVSIIKIGLTCPRGRLHDERMVTPLSAPRTAFTLPPSTLFHPICPPPPMTNCLLCPIGFSRTPDHLPTVILLPFPPLRYLITLHSLPLLNPLLI